MLLPISKCVWNSFIATFQIVLPSLTLTTTHILTICFQMKYHLHNLCIQSHSTNRLACLFVVKFYHKRSPFRLLIVLFLWFVISFAVVTKCFTLPLPRLSVLVRGKLNLFLCENCFLYLFVFLLLPQKVAHHLKMQVICC